MNTETQRIIDAIQTSWINFHNYNAAFKAIQKIKDPVVAHCHFKAVLVEIALTGKSYDLGTQEYL